MSAPPPISAIVHTGDRADVIEDCLRSVRWADELIVVDSFSTDGSLNIARRYADRVIQHEYGFSALQKNWAIPQASHSWVLIVDTDERVTQALRQEIQAALSGVHPFVGYRIPRLNFVFGEPLRRAGYYPDRQLRLFKRDLGRYEMRRVHAHLILDGPCGQLQSPLVHYPHRSVGQTAENLLVLMSKWEAEERQKQAAASGGNPHSRLWVGMLLRPVIAFGLRYFRQGGWRAGYRGLVVSLLWAVYLCLTYMRIWESSLDLPERWWSQDWRGDFDLKIADY